MSGSSPGAGRVIEMAPGTSLVGPPTPAHKPSVGGKVRDKGSATNNGGIAFDDAGSSPEDHAENMVAMKPTSPEHFGFTWRRVSPIAG